MPKKVEYFEGKHNINGSLIIKEYIEGKHYNFEQLSTVEEEKIIDLIRTFHKEGYVDLDIANRNFILTPNKGLYFIDFGWAKTKKEIMNRTFGSFVKTFEEGIKKDWSDLERMLNKSIKRNQ